MHPIKKKKREKGRWMYSPETYREIILQNPTVDTSFPTLISKHQNWLLGHKLTLTFSICENFKILQDSEYAQTITQTPDPCLEPNKILAKYTNSLFQNTPRGCLSSLHASAESQFTLWGNSINNSHYCKEGTSATHFEIKARGNNCWNFVPSPINNVSSVRFYKKNYRYIRYKTLDQQILHNNKCQMSDFNIKKREGPRIKVGSCRDL